MEAHTVSKALNQSHWLESLKPSLEPVAKSDYHLDALGRSPATVLPDQAQMEIQVEAHCAESGPSSRAASQEESISGASASRCHHDQSHGSSLWESSVADISAHATSTIEPSTEASSSLVSPYSVRSSAVISGASSVLPAYSDRASASQSQRTSSGFQLQRGPISLPEHVYWRDRTDTASNMHDIVPERRQVCPSCV